MKVFNVSIHRNYTTISIFYKKSLETPDLFSAREESGVKVEASRNGYSVAFFIHP